MNVDLAYHIACRYVNKLHRHNHRARIVGSVRRGNSDVNDIDILIVKRPGVNYIQMFDSVGAVDLEVFSDSRIKADDAETGIGIDFIFTPPERWGLSTLYFTGGREFNRAWMAQAELLGIEFRRFGVDTGGEGVGDVPYCDFAALELENLTELEILQRLGLEAFADVTTRDIV